MGRILGPGGDPGLQRPDLLRGERFLRVWRRHDDVLVGRSDAPDQFAPPGILGHDRRAPRITAGKCRAPVVEAKATLTRRLIRAVAVAAMLREDRPHVVLKVRRGRRGLESHQEERDPDRGATP